VVVKGLERILELQALDLALDRLTARQQELESGADVEASRTRANELEDRVGELRLGLDSQRREQERLEAEVGSLSAKIAAEERRLFDGSVANPKELESIQAEVAGLRHRKERIEDELLEQMERREEMEGRLPPLEQGLAEARARVSELEASAGDVLRQIHTALEERRVEREALVAALDEELLELYEDLRAQKRGVGAAALEDGVCGGCRQKLSPLELERIKRAEGVRRCVYCRRILVVD
jgi:predicted  nucleic acid-binding Zn-ribbon protein